MANHRRYDRTFCSAIFNRCIDNKITTEDRSLSIFADHDFRDRFAETFRWAIKRTTVSRETTIGLAYHRDQAKHAQLPRNQEFIPGPVGSCTRECAPRGGRESYNFEIDGYPRRINPRGRTYRARVSASSAK